MPSGTPARGSLLRARHGHDPARVTAVELFFDLVFVFAVTQLSHFLLHHLDTAGAAQLALLLLAVWWVWIYTSWVTNWLDPERLPVRVAMLVLLLAGLVLAIALPDAFSDRGMVFAAAYVFMQVGRTLFFLWAARGEARNMVRNFQRILVWLSAAGALWLAGGHAAGPWPRFAWWLAALALEVISPLVYFRVPGLGRSTLADWNVEGAHIAERCSLFVIIALGESLLVTGAAVAHGSWSANVATALATAVAGNIAIWWLYFDTAHERAVHRIVHARQPGREARMAYTYLHALIIAGIIVFAAADGLVLEPEHASGRAAAAVILLGPAIYLLGSALFKWSTNTRRAPPLSHLLGLILLAVLAWPAFAHRLGLLPLAAAAGGALVFTAAWEAAALRRQ